MSKLQSLFRTLLLLLALGALAACTTVAPETASGDADSAGDVSATGDNSASGTTESGSLVSGDAGDSTAVQDLPTTPPPPSTNAAVIALLDTAQADASAGRLPTATANIERALRIEPRNPRLWHELARLKLEKGEYRQAENLAARSNAWAGADKVLQAKNWRLISQARSLRGDNAGSRAALARAKALEGSGE